FVAVGNGGTILTSTNGTNWTAQVSGTANNLATLIFGNGIYVVVGQSGTVLVSSDAKTWTPGNAGVTIDLTWVSFGNGMFLISGPDTAFGFETILRSVNALTWTSSIPLFKQTYIGESISSDNIESIAFADNEFLMAVSVGLNQNAGDGPVHAEAYF